MRQTPVKEQAVPKKQKVTISVLLVFAGAVSFIGLFAFGTLMTQIFSSEGDVVAQPGERRESRVEAEGRGESDSEARSGEPEIFHTPSLDRGDAMPAGFDNEGGISVGVYGVVGEHLASDPEVIAMGDWPDGVDIAHVRVYLDFACGYCTDFFEQYGDALVMVSQVGDVQVTYHPIAILDHASGGSNYSTRAAAAAFSVAELAPDKFLDFSQEMFELQPSLDPTGLSDEELVEIGRDIGLPADVTDTFLTDRHYDWVAMATEKSAQAGVPGTPSVLQDGELRDPLEIVDLTSAARFKEPLPSPRS